MKCQECNKEIDPEYLPSFFCEECVNDFMDKINNGERTKAQIHPEFH